VRIAKKSRVASVSDRCAGVNTVDETCEG